MTNREILQKAIEKAQEGGYFLGAKRVWFYKEKDGPIEEVSMPISEILDTRKTLYYTIIFSHDFAKVFWPRKDILHIKGEVIPYKEYFDDDVLTDWQHHLQQMVLEENPLSYLESFLDA